MATLLTLQRVCIISALCAALGAVGCASVRSAGTGSAHTSFAPHIDVAALRQRITGAHSPLSQLRADVRLVSFGPEGRLRGKAEIYISRPDRMRYTLLGPQGGPLLVLACDGDTLRGLDMRARRFVVGPADAEQFDAWLSPVHLRLDARGWVRLLLGELDVPVHAASAHSAPQDTLALSWMQPDGQQVWAAFGQNDARLRQVRLCQDGRLTTRVIIESRGATGVPERLRIEHTRPGADGISQVELSLQDVDTQTSQNDAVYSLMPPDGFAIIAPHKSL